MDSLSENENYSCVPHFPDGLDTDPPRRRTERLRRTTGLGLPPRRWSVALSRARIPVLRQAGSRRLHTAAWSQRPSGPVAGLVDPEAPTVARTTAASGDAGVATALAAHRPVVPCCIATGSRLTWPVRPGRSVPPPGLAESAGRSDPAVH